MIQDFEVDEFSQEYLSLHPMASKKQPSLMEEHFEPVMEDEDESLGYSNAQLLEEEEEEAGNDRHKASKKSRVPR